MVKESRKSPDFKGEHSSTAYKQNTQKSQWSNCGRREDARISLLGVSRTTGGPQGKNCFSTPPVAGCVLTLSQASCMTLGKSVLEKLLLWYTLVMRRRNVAQPARILLYNPTACKQEQSLSWQRNKHKGRLYNWLLLLHLLHPDVFMNLILWGGSMCFLSHMFVSISHISCICLGYSGGIWVIHIVFLTWVSERCLTSSVSKSSKDLTAME